MCVFVHTVFIFPVFVMYHVLSIQRGNQIEKIENVETLRTLQVLDLSLNRITSLSGLQNLHLLGSINLESNLVRHSPFLNVLLLSLPRSAWYQ